jgi:hypothetical protein
MIWPQIALPSQFLQWWTLMRKHAYSHGHRLCALHAAAAVIKQLRAVEHASGACYSLCCARWHTVVQGTLQPSKDSCHKRSFKLGHAHPVVLLRWQAMARWPSACAARVYQKPCVLVSHSMAADRSATGPAV